MPTEESFEELIRVNLQGPYFLTQAVARHWLETRPEPALPGGHKVVFITSVSADTASVDRGDYCISKAGLAMAAQLWAARLAGENIQVVEVQARHHGDRHDGGGEGEVRPAHGRRPGAAGALGNAGGRRPGRPRFDHRGQLPFSTGSVIAVDGGLHIRRL